MLITVDTELSCLLHQRGASADANFAASIAGETKAGAFGIFWQMDVLERRGLKAVFFVDPMPALVHGPEAIARIVQPIVARGHEVQLHIHSEWLEWAKDPPIVARGQNIGDFSRDDQRILIGTARELLIAAGAPSPTAFRAGNYGANDDTLAVLAELGIAWDASFNGAYAGAPCRISLGPEIVDPVRIGGIDELPVAAIHHRPGRLRAAQICAMSAGEMRAALSHAAETGRPAFAIVTHSFEMLSRDRLRLNRLVMARFEAMCRAIAADPRLRCGGFADLAPPDCAVSTPSRLGPSRLRTVFRQAQQLWGNIAYERALRPA